MIYVACGPMGGPANLFTTPENLAKNPFLLEPLEEIDPEGIELYCIRAESWDEAMQIYYDIQGWGKHKPVDRGE